MTLLIESTDNKNKTVSQLLQSVVLGSLAILSALSFQSVIRKSVELATPAGTKESFLFTLFVASLVLLITIVLTAVWR
jgi:ABC-type arginine transport system permease subunit